MTPPAPQRNTPEEVAVTVIGGVRGTVIVCGDRELDDFSPADRAIERLRSRLAADRQSRQPQPEQEKR